MPIRQLEPDVAAKIAAGEVVERPASVVKELIENSIDAGSTQIRVDLSHGGLQLIRITDNGCGIPPAELPLALARHATSKVAKIDDLEHIRSLGFRGEALASIAAVAEVTLLSRPHDMEQGAQIEAQDGQISEVTPAASPAGTSITVRDLFSAVPARLKFIKSRNTEVNHCHHLLEQYALAYPEIRFSVYSDGRQIFATPGNGQLTSALVEVYGLQIAEQMVQVQGEERPDDPAHPFVSGYTSRPACYKSNRQHISFFVNRRWVMSRMLTSAVESAYHSLLLTGRHPVAVINIQIDPSLLDVNVHPAKTEIRFLKERRVFANIQRAVRAALLEGSEMPEWGAGRHEGTESARAMPVVAVEDEALGNIEIDPVSGEVLQAASRDEDAGHTESHGDVQQPRMHALRASAVFPEDNPWMTVTEEENGSQPPALSRLWQSHVHADSKRTGSARSFQPVSQELALAGPDDLAAQTQDIDIQTQTRTQSAQDQDQRQATEEASTMTPIERLWSQRMVSSTETALAQVAVPDTVVGGTGSGEQASEASLQNTVLASAVQAPVESVSAGIAATVLAGAEQQQGRRLPKLRVVGQVAQSYIVTEGEGGMYLIDQHAAHERILLERMVTSLKARTPLSQLLLTPLQLELSPHEFEGLEEHQAQLEEIGFKLSFEDGVLAVRAVPNVLVKQMNSHSLHELLIELTSAESLGDIGTWEERALANVACKAAIKQNYFLTISEMRELLEQLEQTQAPYSCCHGRPTMVHFGLQALARAFDRR
jgi:DNA mismatch repair protein MutL